jgi:hypothetical protein
MFGIVGATGRVDHPTVGGVPAGSPIASCILTIVSAVEFQRFVELRQRVTFVFDTVAPAGERQPPTKRRPTKRPAATPATRGAAEGEQPRSTPTKNAPTKNAPTKNAPTKNAPTKNAPATNAPTKNAPATNAPTKNAPPPTKNAPTKNAPRPRAAAQPADRSTTSGK